MMKMMKISMVITLPVFNLGALYIDANSSRYFLKMVHNNNNGVDNSENDDESYDIWSEW